MPSLSTKSPRELRAPLKRLVADVDLDMAEAVKHRAAELTLLAPSDETVAQQEVVRLALDEYLAKPARYRKRAA